MGTRNIIIGLILAIILGCAPVEPGTLTRTIRHNDDQRAYQVCMQQSARVQAELHRHCRKMSRLRWANWAWEDCMNTQMYECGHRPRYEDMP